MHKYSFFLIFFDTLKLEACKSRLINVPKYEKNVQWISKLHANSIYCGEHEFALFVVYFLLLDSFIKFSSLSGHFFVHFTIFSWESGYCCYFVLNTYWLFIQWWSNLDRFWIWRIFHIYNIPKSRIVFIS